VSFDTLSLFTTCTDQEHITHTVTTSRLNHTCPHNRIFFCMLPHSMTKLKVVTMGSDIHTWNDSHNKLQTSTLQQNPAHWYCRVGSTFVVWAQHNQMLPHDFLHHLNSIYTNTNTLPIGWPFNL
jgi:hypothetical protein